MCWIDRRGFLKAAAGAGLITYPSALAALADAEHVDRVLLALPEPSPIPPRVADYPLRAVRLDRVDITDRFWRPRMETNRSVSLRVCFDRFGREGGFNVSKLIEAAAYMIEKRPDPELEAFVDARISELLAGMERRSEGPEQAVRVSGHFLEAAAAWSAATGKREMLDAALHRADEMDSFYGPGKRTYISGHEGLKIGLIALYRATGDDRYWRLARFFADERGRDDYPRTGEYAIDRTYAQDHEPVVEQSEALGHCVRATFLYIAMTDIAALTGNEAYRHAVHRIWEDQTYRKTYLTGGIGSVRFHEQYGAAHEFPNLSAWNETCAAYGNAVWNHRLALLEADARYVDVMERVLYNALLVGVSLAGDRFFYQNPLMSFGDYARFERINVPCCPPNVVRLLASLGSYVYATAPSGALYVNLFVDSDARLDLAGAPVHVRQETRYPWNGNVRLHVAPSREVSFPLYVRIPGWARGQVMPGDLYRFADPDPGPPVLRVNGENVALETDRGYARLERVWRPGDVVELDLPMPVRRVRANEAVADDRDRVALRWSVARNGRTMAAGRCTSLFRTGRHSPRNSSPGCWRECRSSVEMCRRSARTAAAWTRPPPRIRSPRFPTTRGPTAAWARWRCGWLASPPGRGSRPGSPRR